MCRVYFASDSPKADMSSVFRESLLRAKLCFLRMSPLLSLSKALHTLEFNTLSSDKASPRMECCWHFLSGPFILLNKLNSWNSGQWDNQSRFFTNQHEEALWKKL